MGRRSVLIDPSDRASRAGDDVADALDAFVGTETISGEPVAIGGQQANLSDQ